MQLAGEAEPLQMLYGYPGPFGAFSLGLLNDTATPPAPLALASPLNACGAVAAAPAAGAAAVVARGNCSFADKASALQKAGWGAMLLFNNEEGTWNWIVCRVKSDCVHGWPLCVTAGMLSRAGWGDSASCLAAVKRATQHAAAAGC